MISKVKILSLCFCFFILVNTLQSQSTTILKQTSDSLQNLNNIIMNSSDEEQLLSANVLFCSKLNELLRQPTSYTYSFDSLKVLSVLMPNDKSFRLITWYIPMADGTYQYYGFVQISPKLKSAELVYELHDSSASATHVEHSTFTNLNWYGAKYYKLIDEKVKGVSYYTLLAWDGNAMNSNKKIIDVLTFNDKQEPVFGSPIFKIDEKGKILSRVIFEYAEDAAFSLKYEKQTVPNTKKKGYMIVFDRLYPISDNLKGQAAFYVPATNICDGFKFTKGEWLMVKDIDVRNAQTKVKRRKPSK